MTCARCGQLDGLSYVRIPIRKLSVPPVMPGTVIGPGDSVWDVLTLCLSCVPAFCADLKGAMGHGQATRFPEGAEL